MKWATALILASLITTSSLSFSRSVRAATPSTISIPAGQPWTDTGIDVSAGQHITISASGLIAISGFGPAWEPDGGPGPQPDDSSSPGPLLPTLSLIGRIGTGGSPFFVGSFDDFVAPVAGRLYLGVNDGLCCFGDNSGTWSATVTLGDIVSIPPPPPPPTPPGTVGATASPVPRTWSAPAPGPAVAPISSLPRIAIGPDHTLHAVWATYPDGAHGQTMYAELPPGGSWSSPVTLGSAIYDYPTRAVGAGPDNTVHTAWTGPGGTVYDIQAAEKLQGGSWSAGMTLSAGTSLSLRSTLAVDSQGTTYLAWDDSTAGSHEILLAQEPAGGNWSTPDNVSNTPRASWEPTLTVGSDGTLHLAWVDYTPGNFTIFYASRPPGSVWSSPVAVSAPGFVFWPAIATDAAGGVHLVWSSQTPMGSGWRTQLVYAYRSPAGTWSAPEVIPGTNGATTLPTIAVDTLGRLQVLWSTSSQVLEADRLPDGSWTTTSTFAGTQTDLSLAEDDQNTLHVLYASGGQTLYIKGTPATPPLTVNAGGPYSGNEGSPISLDGATASDSDGDTLTYAWSALAAPEPGASCTVSSPSARNPNVTCNEEGKYTLQLSVRDGVNVNSPVTSNAIVTVGDLAPQVSISQETMDQLIPVSSAGGTASVTVDAPFTDAGTLDSHTCTVQWDMSQTAVSGNVNESVGTGTGTCSATNNLAPGVYLITVSVRDSDGTLAGTASTEAVVYDTSSGFVTGGGWINSPAGAMPASPTLTGNANFGFVSKYQKGSTVPTGETEFQFQVGNLDFHSNMHTALVVSGNQAQYRGTGTINGVNDSSGTPYKFILTALDGDMKGGTIPDGFRMKITDSSGTVVYDNKLGASNDLGNTQIIAGGNIVIHS